MGVAVAVLMYHAVGAPPPGRFRRFVVPPGLLGDQLDALAAAGYRCVDLLSLVQAIDRGEDLARLVAVTFDDGFADFAELAAPLLADRGVGATVYVPSGYVGRRASWLERAGAGDRPVMSWAALADVARAGFEVGAHGVSHLGLDAVRGRVAAAEIGTSRRVLEDGLGVPVTTMAYPFGYESATTRRLARDAGYVAAAAVRYALWDPRGDRHAISRLLVGPDISPDALVDIVGGADTARIVPRAKRLVGPAWRAARILVPALTPRAPRGAP